MRTEVVRWKTCERCKGTGGAADDYHACDTCSGIRETWTVLATIPERAALRERIAQVIGCSSGDMGFVPHVAVVRAADAVLALFGLGVE